MTHFVLGDDLPLSRIEQSVAFLQPHHDALDGSVEVFHGDGIGLATRGQQGRLIDENGEIGTSEPGVRAAICSTSTSGASLALFECTLRI